jgi:predicted dehydrogenase
MASKYDIPSVFTDYRELIEKGDLDACIIVTPTDTHYAMTMLALEAGLHVMCEKPLALTVEQAREMYRKAEAAGVKHMVFFTRRWYPHFRYLKQLVDEGYLGEPRSCHISWTFGWAWDGEYMWRADRRRSPGALGELGPHMIDFARWYGGDIARVNAHLATFVPWPGPEGQVADPANDSFALLLEFASGAQGLLHACVRLNVGFHRLAVSLAGDVGALEAVSDGDGYALRGAREEQQTLEPLTIPADVCGGLPPDPSQFQRRFCEHSVGDRLFIDTILEDRQPAPSFYDGLKVQEVIGAAIESHETGRWVVVGSEPG